MTRSFYRMTLALVAVFLATAPAQAQHGRAEAITVSGVVLDEMTGEGLEGASVHVSGTRLGTLTDEQGHYELRGVPNQNVTLVSSRLGYIRESREIWVCTPVLHPGNVCSPPPPADQHLNFFLRTAPRTQAAARLTAPLPTGR